MADEEAEQERLSRSRGGCAAELQRLSERLQELERQLRESRVPAVEAATEYCQQLCQVKSRRLRFLWTRTHVSFRPFPSFS
uniref:Zinc finger protein 292 n=2 Tax=Sus scrofa TaxID=9823 RepID=A0A8D2BWL5_PIG